MYLENNKLLYIFSIYNSIPNNNNLCRDLQNLIRGISNDNYFLIGGDFNAKHISWNNYNNNTNGIQLRQWLNDKCFLIKQFSSTHPTYVAGSRESWIDFFLISMNLNINYPTNRHLKVLDFESDHKAVKLII